MYAKRSFSLLFYFCAIVLGLYALAFRDDLNPMLLFSVLCLFKCIGDFALDRVKAFAPSFFFVFSSAITSFANYSIQDLFSGGIKLAAYKYAIPTVFPEASAIWILGTTSVLFGMEVVLVSRDSSLVWILPLKHFRTFFIISLIIVFKKLATNFNFPGAIGDIVDVVPLAAILFFARIGIIDQNKKYLYYSIILTMCLASMNILFSYLRLEMILPVIVLFIGLFSGGVKVRQLLNPAFTPIYFFIVIFLIFFEVYGSVRSEMSDGVNRIIALGKVDQSRILDEKKITPFQRSANISQLSAVVNLVHKNGSYEGRASLPLVTAMVPRVFWPEKPKIALGVWFAIEINEAIKSGDWYNTSINMTIPGHLYLDFGWIGVIIGCFLVGLLINYLWQTTRFHDTYLNVIGTVLGTYLIYNCFLGIGADLQIIITLVAYVILLLLLKKILPRQ